MSKVIKSNRHQEAIERALDTIQHLPVKQMVICALGFGGVIGKK
jgi:hypothetical protein